MEAITIARRASGFDLATLFRLERYFAIPAMMMAVYGFVYIDPWAPLTIAISAVVLHLALTAVSWFDRQENRENYQLTENGLKRCDNQCFVAWERVANIQLDYEVNDAFIGGKQLALRLRAEDGSELIVIRPGQLLHRGRELILGLEHYLPDVFERLIAERASGEGWVFSTRPELVLDRDALTVRKRGAPQRIPLGTVQAIEWAPLPDRGRPKDRIRIRHQDGEFSLYYLPLDALLFHYQVQVVAPQLYEPHQESPGLAQLQSLFESVQARRLMVVFAMTGLICFGAMCIHFTPFYLRNLPWKYCAIDACILLIGVGANVLFARSDVRALRSLRSELAAARAALWGPTHGTNHQCAKAPVAPSAGDMTLTSSRWRAFALWGLSGAFLLAALGCASLRLPMSPALRLGGVVVFAILAWPPGLLARRVFYRRQRQRLVQTLERRHAATDGQPVRLLPRRNWGLFRLFPETDLGLLRLDEASCELRYEGLNERYAIPFQALVSCRVERIDESIPAHFAVVIRAYVDGHPNWERAFVVDRGGLRSLRALAAKVRCCLS